jgi:hypothetical protein
MPTTEEELKKGNMNHKGTHSSYRHLAAEIMNYGNYKYEEED